MRGTCRHGSVQKVAHMTRHARISARALTVVTALILAIGLLAGSLASAAGPTVGLGTASSFSVRVI